MAIEKTLYQIESLLIVDDSTVQREHTVGLMRDMGVDLIYEAGNGHEALELLAMLKLPPSLAIIDLEMPGMDGVELIQQLQQSQATFPLIVASSRETSLLSSVETMIQALGMRVLGALQKPLNREKIVAAMKSFDVAASTTAKKRQPAIDLRIRTGCCHAQRRTDGVLSAQG